MFYHIIWCPSIRLCVYNCHFFSFHCYVTSFVFYQKLNVRAFIIILGVTMKKTAFESYPETNGFVEKLVIFLVINLLQKQFRFLFFVSEPDLTLRCLWIHQCLLSSKKKNTFFSAKPSNFYFNETVKDMWIIKVSKKNLNSTIRNA